MEKIIETFKKDLQNPLNSKCIDCHKYDCITKCSVNNGVYLCSSCATLHNEYLSLETSDIRVVPIIKGMKPIPGDERMKTSIKKVVGLTQDQELKLIN